MIGFVLALAASLCGCVGSLSPPALDDEKLHELRDTRFDADVGVVRDEGFSFYILNALRRSRLFNHVAYLDEMDDPEIIAYTKNKWVYNISTPTVPLFTYLTLGLVPTIIHEDYGESFELRSRSGRTGVIEFVAEGRIILGWPGLVVAGFSKNYTASDTRKSERYRQRVGWEIVSNCRFLEAYRRPVESD